jgi:hypothetical protein
MSVEVKNYLEEEVVEEVHADTVSIPANTTTPSKVESGTIRQGYKAVAVSVAVTRDANCYFWLKVAGKQVYSNGLNCAGIGAGANLENETLLLVPIEEGGDWEIGFTNKSASAVTLSYRFRLRLFKVR